MRLLRRAGTLLRKHLPAQRTEGEARTMLIAEDIETLPIVEVKRDFYKLMNEIILFYGDNQEEGREQEEKKK